MMVGKEPGSRRLMLSFSFCLVSSFMDMLSLDDVVVACRDRGWKPEVGQRLLRHDVGNDGESAVGGRNDATS